MRILFIAKNIPVPGKAGNPVVLEIARRLQERGHNLFVVFPKEWVPWFLRKHPKYRHLYDLLPWEYQDIPVVPWTYPRLPGPAHAYRLLPFASKRLIRHTSSWSTSDVIHAHYLLPDAWMAVVLGQVYGIPVMVTLRSTDVKLLRKAGRSSHTWRMAGEVLQQVQGVTALNGSVREFFEEAFGVSPHLIPHGIPGEQILPKIPDSKDVDVLTVAHAIPRKQIDWVIRAFLQAPPAVAKKMVVVGDGPCLTEWQQLAGDDPRIFFTGKISHDEVLDWMRRSKVFALPSSQETFGLVYLEAAAAGNALIGRAGEGVVGVFTEEDGMVFPSDYGGFQNDLHQLLTNHTLCTKRAQAARQRATQLSWRAILTRYEEAYVKARNLLPPNNSSTAG